MKEVHWHQQGVIPELLYFQNGGSFSGSVNHSGDREFRFKLSPSDEKIRAEVWYGPFCYEKSTIEDHSDFPMEEQGREKAINWLQEKYQEMIP
ncbi:MAG: hypothetical protein LKJ45_03740 [Oscillospiraceae bacterium]|jgi:hypothetical protein|nr:hypothetical protein [Oscillospiraceae bacterium]